MDFFASFDWKTNPFWKGKKGNKKIILLHGNSATQVTFQSPTRTVRQTDLQQLVHDTEKPLILLAAPFAYTYIQQTIHLKKNELLQADNQTLGFSRFLKENRILESIYIDSEHALTTYTHLSDLGNQTIVQLNSNKQKYRWQPAVPFIIRQFIQHPLVDSQLFINLMMDREILRLGWKDKKVAAHHLFYWTQNDDHSRMEDRAEQLMDSKFPASLSIPIRVADNIPKNARTNKIIQNLFFPSNAPVQVKTTRKQIQDNRLVKLKKIPFKYLLVATTVLLLVWTAQIKLKLYNYRTSRTELMKTISSLRLSTAGLEKISRQERLLVKITALAQATQSTSWDPLNIIDKIQPLLPETAWIQTLKINRNSIHLQLLDSGNSDISKTIGLLMENFGDVRLDDNSTLQLETHSLRKMSFTINHNILNDTNRLF